MVTCIQCGNALLEGETTCGRCGASAQRGDGGTPEPAARGEAPRGEAPAGAGGESAGATGGESAGAAGAESAGAAGAESAGAAGAESAGAADGESGGAAEGESAGAAGSPSGDGEGPHAPVGTWSETGEIDVRAVREGAGTGSTPRPAPAENASAATSSATRADASDREGVLTFRDTHQATGERAGPPLRPERIVRDPDLTPVPGLAVALATRPKPRHDEPESTGMRPTMKEEAPLGGARSAKDRPMGQVVPLRRDAPRAADAAGPAATPAGSSSTVDADSLAGSREGGADESGPRSAEASQPAPTGAVASESAPSAPDASHADSAAVVADGGALPADAREPGTGAPADGSQAGTAGAADVSVPSAEADGRRRGDESVRTKSAEVSAARTPPVLASESLREDLAPTEPGRRAMRWVSATVGTLGAGVALGVGEGGFSVSIVAGLLLGCAVLGVVSIRYSARSIGVTVLGLAGLVVAVVATGVEATPPVLAITVTVLAAGLLFRGMYRASGVARALVGIGIALALVWFIGSGAIAGLSVIDTSWQSVGGAIVRLVFALLLLLSLLAFMDSSTTAGCRVWGGALLAWYAVFVALELATRIWPAPGHPADAPDGIVARLLGGTPLGPPDPQVTAMALAGAAFIALVGYAGSHVLVTLSGGTIIHRGGASASQSER